MRVYINAGYSYLPLLEVLRLYFLNIVIYSSVSLWFHVESKASINIEKNIRTEKFFLNLFEFKMSGFSKFLEEMAKFRGGMGNVEDELGVFYSARKWESAQKSKMQQKFKKPTMMGVYQRDIGTNWGCSQWPKLGQCEHKVNSAVFHYNPN